MRKLTKVLMIVNFVLLILLIGLASSHSLYLTEKRLGIGDTIDISISIWLIASTLLSVILFIWILVSKSRGGRKEGPTAFDWALFLGWFFAIGVICLFAFLTGVAA
jgi:hypothetical protein